MSINLENDINWFAIQYQLTNLQNLLKEISDVQQTLLIDVISQYSSRYSIDTATGTWLDYVGFRYGIFTRPVLPVQFVLDYFGFDISSGTGFDQAAFISDETDNIPVNDDIFRSFLKAIVPQLVTNCTLKDIRDALLIFFEEIIITDDQDMTFSVTIITDISPEVVQSVLVSGIITKPAAVGLQTVILIGGYFGFDDSGGTGFDQSAFIFKG
ncbi:MAG: DUF2612 domain-containing protein [Gammaproteobacteria bacterium]